MKKLSLLVVLFLCTSVSALLAQTRTITGTVTSAVEGEGPIPGVSVSVPGTTLGAFTDADGKYTIKVPQNAKVLVFSFIGMKTKEVSITGDKIDVVLEQDLLNLDEIIVTGVAAGTPKKKMAVSVERVDATALKEVTAGSASAALQGKVSGLTVISATGEPGSAATILVRGATQITGSQAPLIILDGAIMEGTLGDINVDDIEAIEVVKGASAASLYGSRAGNGVIAVTTRRGNTIGEGRSEIIIRNEYGINSLAKEYNLSEHHAFELASDQSSYAYTRYAGVTYPSDYHSTELGVTGSRNVKADQYMDNPYGRIYNHEREVFAGSSFFTNYISVGTNLGKTNFLTSFENNDQSGLVAETDGYKRNSFRVNVDHKVSAKLSLSASNLFVRSSTQDPGGDNKYNGGVFFNVLLFEPDVDFFYPNPDGQPYNFTANTWQNEQENPLYNLWKIQDKTTRDRILGTYSAKYNITDFLNFEGKYAFEYSTTHNSQYSPYDTYTSSSGAPVYSQGYMYLYNSHLFSQNIQATANFNKKFGDFTTKAKLSYLFERQAYNSNSTTGYDFAFAGVPTIDAIAGSITSTNYVDLVIAKNYFGILYLDYKDKYIFDGMIRYDGSSLFGADVRWNPYYRVSGAYRITEDIKIPGVQELKLRAAYGTAGQRPGFSDQYEVMNVSNGVVLGRGHIGNTKLKPSLSQELEVGINLDFLNRFSLEVVRSEINTTDQILNVPLPVQYGGWASQWQNAGALNSKVWEASLNVAVARKKDFTYNIGFVFDRIRTTITELDVPAFQTGPQGQEADKAFYIRKGETFGSMYGYKFLKSLDELAEQVPADQVDNYCLNSDGYVILAGTEGTTSEGAVKKTNADGTLWFGKIGDSNPKFKIAMTNNFNYKGIGLYALIEWKNGGDIYNKSAQWLTRDDRHGMMDQYGKPDYLKKTITYYKVFYDVNNQNDFWVEDGSYLKLREVALSYQLGSDKLSGVFNGYVKGIKLSVIGKNLYTLSKYTGYDPEVATTDGTQYFAYDFMGYPNYRSYSVSLELKF